MKPCVFWDMGLAFCRAEFIKRSFRGESAATHVSDVVRKVDVEMSRYKRLVETFLVQFLAMASK